MPLRTFGSASKFDVANVQRAQSRFLPLDAVTVYYAVVDAPAEQVTAYVSFPPGAQTLRELTAWIVDESGANVLQRVLVGGGVWRQNAFNAFAGGNVDLDFAVNTPVRVNLLPFFTALGIDLSETGNQDFNGGYVIVDLAYVAAGGVYPNSNVSPILLEIQWG